MATIYSVLTCILSDVFYAFYTIAIRTNAFPSQKNDDGLDIK